MKYLLIIVTLLSVTLAFTFTKTVDHESISEHDFSTTKVDEQAIDWKKINLAEAQKLSKKTGKPIYINISAAWCGYCKKMKKNVYSKNKVASEMNDNYIAIAIDGEKGEGIALVKKHKIKGYPTQLILDAEGNILKRNNGYMSESKLLEYIK